MCLDDCEFAYKSSIKITVDKVADVANLIALSMVLFQCGMTTQLFTPLDWDS